MDGSSDSNCIMAFAIPLFAPIPKKAKWTFGASIPIATSILIAQWLMNLAVVQPAVVPADELVCPF